MAWTAPFTAVANAAFTAAQFNQYVRDNLNETAPAKATTAGRWFVSTGLNSIAQREISTNFVGTPEATTSTSFTNLATAGPSVTVSTGSTALVFITAMITNNTVGERGTAAYAISGATTVAANGNFGIVKDTDTAGRQVRATVLTQQSGLTTGSNTFTLQYSVSAGTGTFSLRSITVMAL